MKMRYFSVKYDPNYRLSCQLSALILQKPPHEYVGELLLSLNYFPTTQRLTIVILKARNLKIESTSGLWGEYLAHYMTSR